MRVTAADIKAGKPCNADSCPVARALRRAMRTDYASVGPGHMDAWDEASAIGKKLCTETPSSVTAFIAKFDLLKKVKPFRFTLRLP